MHHSRAISLILATTILVAVISPISGQVSTSCTTALISSFTPCFNYITGSTNGGGSPTTSCCNSLASIVTTSTDCACLILTGNVPFSLPINRTLAISLPRICNSSVPLQCRATATPLPSPGPVAYGPSLPPLPPLPPSSSVEPEPPAPTAEGFNDGQRPLILPSSATKLFSLYYVSASVAVIAFLAMFGI